MNLSSCNICGAEVLLPEFGRNPKFCRRCGENLTPGEGDRIDPPDEDDFDEDFISSRPTIFNYQELEKIIENAVPENYQYLTPTQLKNQIVRKIWEQITGIDPQPYDQSLDCEEREHEMLKCIEADTPPALSLPAQSPSAKPDYLTVRQYHLVWVNGQIFCKPLELTARECEEMRSWMAKYYYNLEPCNCRKNSSYPDK